MARAAKLSQNRIASARPSACTRGRQRAAASAQRAKPCGISVSSRARIACANTGAAPSVETPMTRGERLTIAPNAKSQNAGLSMTLTGPPAARAAAAKRAASPSSWHAATAMAAPGKAAGVHGRTRILTVPWIPLASANNSALGSGAYTSTRAPAALSSSAFHAAAALPPATMARRPSSLRNTGSRASGAMRAGGGAERVSDRAIAASINAGLITAGLLEVGDEGDRLVRRARPEGRNHVDERALHVLRHMLGVAAHIDMRAVGDPRPQVAPNFAHAMLDVDFLLAVARPREREPREHAGRFHAGKLVLIEKVIAAVLMTEEQPVAPGGLRGHALVQERAERRDAGAGADHDDRNRRIGRQPEALRLLHVSLHLAVRRDAAGEEGRGDAEPRARAQPIAHRIDRERDSVRVDLGRRGDGIKPRLQRIEGFDEGFRVGPHAAEFFQRGKHVERLRVAVRIAALGERVRLLPALAAREIGDELEQHVGRRRERHAVGKHLAQRAPADGEVRRRVDRFEHRLDQSKIVGREEAQAITNRVFEPGGADVELDMPGFLARARLVEKRA